MRKITKRAAFEMIKNAIEANEGLEGATLAELLPFFAPAVPAKAKTATQWVQKALGVNSTRIWMDYLHAHDGYLYATDGHRAHRAPTDMADGYYHPTTLLPAPYIDTHLVSPVVEVFNATTPTDAATFADATVYQVTDKLQELRFDTLPVGVNQRYLLAATNGDTTAKINYGERKFMGTSEFGEYLIMGME